MLRMLDLFSGIGGFSLAATWTGKIEHAGFCEIDEWCRERLAARFPGVPIHDDVTTLTGDTLARLGRIDIVCGGYPCQPFSLAGRRMGAEDDRHLWPYMRRIINECRPTFIIAENVAGHITMGIDVVLSDMEEDGYTGRPVIVPAASVAAKHRRDRVWILARKNGITDADAIGNERRPSGDTYDQTGSIDAVIGVRD